MRVGILTTGDGVTAEPSICPPAPTGIGATPCAGAVTRGAEGGVKTGGAPLLITGDGDVVAKGGAGALGPELMKRAVEPVAAPVAGEHPSRPIATMRCRREPDEEQPRLWIAESRDRPGPVLLFLEAGDFDAAHLFPPRDEAWTQSAVSDCVIDVGERSHQGGCIFSWNRCNRKHNKKTWSGQTGHR